jgi:hypothetical protein
VQHRTRFRRGRGGILGFCADRWARETSLSKHDRCGPVKVERAEATGIGSAC